VSASNTPINSHRIGGAKNKIRKGGTSPPQNAAAPNGFRGWRQQTEHPDRNRPRGIRQSSHPLIDFLRRPSLATFTCAFPHLAGRDLSFSEWLERNHDALPKPEGFSEWIASIHSAIDDDFVPRRNQPAINRGWKQNSGKNNEYKK
jgi:hypothetical protein